MYVISFVSGFAILLLEILGFRLFAPFYGNSIYVTGSMITVVLIALASGYVTGGRFADKYPDFKVLIKILFLSALYLILIGFTYQYILGYLVKLGFVYGAIVSATVIFFVPMTLMSMTSPFLIKILSKDNNVGKVSGNIFAVETLGSIAGSLITTFMFIPTFGSRLTLLGCAVFLTVIFGIYSARKYSALCCLAILPLFFMKPVVGPYVIYSTESVYNVITVHNAPIGKYLALNHPGVMQSVEMSSDKIPMTYSVYFNIGPALSDAHDILILGIGGGTSVSEFLYFYDANIDAVEIDPAVVDVAKKYFNLETSNPKLKVFIEDAKIFLKQTDKLYDFIEVDVFQGGPYIPFFLATKEFYEELKPHLRQTGFVSVNMMGQHSQSDKNSLIAVVGNTLSSVFPYVYMMPVRSNTIFFASVCHQDIDEIKTKAQMKTPKRLSPIVAEFTNNLTQVKYNKDIPVFTNDKSNIEEMLFKLLHM